MIITSASASFQGHRLVELHCISLVTSYLVKCVLLLVSNAFKLDHHKVLWVDMFTDLTTNMNSVTGYMWGWECLSM